MSRVVIDEDRCKGCTLCNPACPQRILVMAETFNAKGYHPATLRDPENKCTGCCLCARMCPDAAITVYRDGKRKAGVSGSKQLGH
jgi:2-oxoglutarate ferredoxin oxidoreductase subunit delta